MATIAVDFDGTIVKHRYPEIGEEIPFATDTLRMLIREHHRLILWTVREGKLLQDAIDLGADCYISGEISERTTHLAREAGVVYAAAGHHATERCGVQALGRHLAETFGIEVTFVDDPNPV